MPVAPYWLRVRHVVGRALRETGQALDRVALRARTEANAPRRIGADLPSLFHVPLSRHRRIMPLLRRGAPDLDPRAGFVAPCATLIGRVTVGPGSSVWYGAVLRADRCNAGLGALDNETSLRAWRAMSDADRAAEDDGTAEAAQEGGEIVVGADTNVQDGAVVTANATHTRIGDRVTIGHGAHVCSATVGNDALIGMGAVLRPRSVVEDYAFVAAGAVVGEGTTVPSGELWAGSPARKLRTLTDEERNKLTHQAHEYVKLSVEHIPVMTLGGNVSDEGYELHENNPLIEEGKEEGKPLSDERI